MITVRSRRSMMRIQRIHVFQHVKRVIYCILLTDPPVCTILGHAHRRLAKEQQAPGAELRADAEDVAEDLLAGRQLANQSSGMELGCQVRGVRKSSNVRLEQYNARFIEERHGHNLLFHKLSF